MGLAFWENAEVLDEVLSSAVFYANQEAHRRWWRDILLMLLTICADQGV